MAGTMFAALALAGCGSPTIPETELTTSVPTTTLLPVQAIAGDAVIDDGQGTIIRSDISCEGQLCTLTLAGERTTLDLADLSSGENLIPETVPGQRKRNGVNIGRVTETVVQDGIRIDFDSYGVWGEHNVGTASLMTISAEGVAFRTALPWSVGHPTGSFSYSLYCLRNECGEQQGTNPTSGTASWSGAMAGVKIGSLAIGEEVTGDADLTANLAAATINLTFSNIETASGMQSPDIAWRRVSMHNGSFNAAGLEGRFYGHDHEEAGGVFRRDGIEGAFSLARE